MPSRVADTLFASIPASLSITQYPGKPGNQVRVLQAAEVKFGCLCIQVANVHHGAQPRHDVTSVDD